MSMHFVTATDENGVDFDALTNSEAEKDADGRQNVWVFTDKKSGFGDDPGRVNLHQLKQLPDGKYGA